jgi:hypothetical protein
VLGTPWLAASPSFSNRKIIRVILKIKRYNNNVKTKGEVMSRKELSELAVQVYKFANKIRTVPEISERIMGKDHNDKTKTAEFFKVCNAVDELIEEGLVYMNDAGVLLDLMR